MSTTQVKHINFNDMAKTKHIEFAPATKHKQFYSNAKEAPYASGGSTGGSSRPCVGNCGNLGFYRGCTKYNICNECKMSDEFRLISQYNVLKNYGYLGNELDKQPDASSFGGKQSSAISAGSSKALMPLKLSTDILIYAQKYMGLRCFRIPKPHPIKDPRYPCTWFYYEWEIMRLAKKVKEGKVDLANNHDLSAEDRAKHIAKLTTEKWFDYNTWKNFIATNATSATK